MISRSGNKNFLMAHYEFLALGVGLLALAVGIAVYVMALGTEPEAAVAESEQQVARMKPGETGVKKVDLTEFENATRLIRSPLTLAEVPEKSESFLASERRVLCKCKKAIPGDVKLCPKCPYCGAAQEEEKKVVLDADGDGLPDEWERKYGLNPGDAADAAADSDNDGFTNAEEYAAKTDPTNAKDHPDYLASLRIQLPLKNTYLPFVFISANKIPKGWRCAFYNAKEKDDYGRLGRTYTAVIGEEIGKSGYVLKGYEQKEEKRAIKGGQGMQKRVDVSIATLERKADGKVVKVVISANKKAKPASVDVQATLVYERGTVQNFEVVPGSELNLNGAKYKVVDIKAIAKGAQVTVEDSYSAKKHTLEALEP